MSLIKSWRSNCITERSYKHGRPVTLHILERKKVVVVMYSGGENEKKMRILFGLLILFGFFP